MSKSLRSVTDSDIRLLGVFHKVVACGGISAAELDLNIGRSTISRHLKDLEIRLGVKLCHRGHSGFSLTAEGIEIYDASLKLFDALKEFRGVANLIQENIKGVLNIGVFDKVVSNPKCNIHEAIEKFCAEYPKIKLEIYVDPLNKIENKVMAGEFQLGIVPIHKHSASLEYFKLFSEKMYLYCGRGHGLFKHQGEAQSTEIKKYPFAGMGFNSPNQTICRELGFKQAATAYDQEGIAILIRSGKFLGFLPDHYADAFVKKNLFRKVDCEGYSYQCEFAVIYPRSARPERAAEELLKALKAAHESD